MSYNDIGYLSIQLPQGAIYDSFKLSLFVQIIDDSDGIIVYNIPGKIICELRDGFIAGVTEEILNNGGGSAFVKDLNSGNLQTVSKNIIAFTSIINKNEVSLFSRQIQYD